LTQIWSVGRPVVYCISKQIDFLKQVLGLGWVYLATKGFISLAHLGPRARNSNDMVTCNEIYVDTDSVWLKTFLLLNSNVINQFFSSVVALAGKLSRVGHLPTSYIPY
jgi:hypothetical protein